MTYSALPRPSVHPEHLGLRRGTPPARRLTKRRPSGSLRGSFASTEKALSETPFESLLEKDFMTLLEADPSIRSYAAQPHRLTYLASDKHGHIRQHLYTPDFIAEDREGRTIVMEIKARGLAELARWKRLEPYIRIAYEELGLIYCVFTEESIRVQPRLSNCQLMNSRGRAPFDHAAEIKVRKAFTSLPKAFPIERLYDRLEAINPSQKDRIFSTVLHLALRGVIVLDLSKPLSRNAAIISVR